MEHQGEQLSSVLARTETSPWVVNSAEKGYIRSQLNIAEATLRRIDATTAVDANIAAPHIDRSEVIHCINQCRAALSPDGKLPAELIREVILYYIWGEPLTLDKNDPRIQITQVCSSWRNVAFATHKVWDMHLEKSPGEHSVNLIAEWLRQCTNTKIHFTMSHENLAHLSYGQLLLKEVVIPNAHRLKALSCPPVLSGQWCSLPFDVLTTLSLSSSPFPTCGGKHLNAPFLRTLKIVGIAQTSYTEKPGSGLLKCLPKIPWGQLTSIGLEGSIYFPDVYEVLSLCTSLEKCNLDAIHPHARREVPTDASTISLPYLKELRICFASDEIFEDVYLLDVPNLVTLGITVPPEDLFEFLKKKAETLRSFEMIPAYFSYTILTPGEMRALPFVTRFLAGHQYIKLETLREIGMRELLPELEVLEFRAMRKDTVDNILDALLPQRSDGTLSLTKICISVDGPECLCSETRIEDLRLRGITVCQKY